VALARWSASHVNYEFGCLIAKWIDIAWVASVWLKAKQHQLVSNDDGIVL
jgi:hypothetical protein